jgi:hypothetical protein
MLRSDDTLRAHRFFLAAARDATQARAVSITPLCTPRCSLTLYACVRLYLYRRAPDFAPLTLVSHSHRHTHTLSLSLFLSV